MAPVHSEAAVPAEAPVALITGGASGIGQACAEAFATQGAAVVVADLRMPAAEKVVAALAGRSTALELDVRDEISVARGVESVVSTYGRIDVLVNSAALTDRAHHDRDVDPAAMDLGVWRATFATDLEGILLMCRAVVPVMVRGGGGSIINISSNAAEGGDVVRAAYSAAKAGVNSLTRSVAVAYGPSGIRANAVSPAGIVGPSFQQNLSAADRERIDRQRLLPYSGRPADVAELVTFLASERARYITGQVIAVDGGVRSQLPHVPAFRAEQQA